VALERANICILCGGARTHGTLAQIDFLEIRAWSRRVVVEERTLRDRLANGALDIALTQIVTALELLIKSFEDAARLLTCAARTFYRDVIAALFRHDAEAAFDQC